MLSLVRTNLSASKRLLGSFANAYEVLKENGEVTNYSQLDNEMKVVSHNSGRNTATVGVWIESGSSFENSDNNGVATLFEHLLYTGTSKRTAQQLQSELAKIGARLNSFTSREHTAYFAECFADDVPKVVEVVADVMLNSKMDKLEEQRDIVVQKLEEHDNDYRNVVFENLHKTAFQGTTYSLSPLGSYKSLKALTKEDIQNFVDDHYKPARMVLSGAGGVQHEHLSELAQKYFGHLKNEYKRKIPEKTGVRFSGSEFLYRDDNYPLMFGAIAVEGVRRADLDYIPLMIASTAVGQWDKSHATSLNAPSVLVQKICQNPELLHFESFNFNYDTTGLFGVYFVMKGYDDYEISNAVFEIQRQWKHLSYGINDDDADQAKNQLKTNIFTALENNTALAHHLAAEALSTGAVTPLHVLERKIHYCDAAAIREAMSRHVYDRDLACAGIGKTEAWPNYVAIRAAMSWWRL